MTRGSGRLRERHSWTEGAVVTALVVTGLLLFLAGQGHGEPPTGAAPVTATTTTRPPAGQVLTGAAGGEDSSAPTAARTQPVAGGGAATTTPSLVGAGPTATAAAPRPAAGPAPAGAGPAGPRLTGQIVGSSGAPVPGAYLIGLRSLHVTRADASGRFSMACPAEPLVASSWLIPLLSTDPGLGRGFGVDTTTFGPIPGDQALGYVFTGGATAASAQPPVCGAAPLQLVLPAAAVLRVTHQYEVTSGTPPPGEFQVPGLGADAVNDQTPVDPDNDQLATGLDPGTVVFTPDPNEYCTYPAQHSYFYGPTPIPVLSGQIVTIDCD